MTGKAQEDGDKARRQGALTKESHKTLPPMSDTEFALAVDARLWVSPSGEMRDNIENYRAVDESLTELDSVLKHLQDLLESLIRLQSWRTFPQLAAPVLEALLFIQDIVGQIAMPRPREEPVSKEETSS